jgi:hypothetical protein
MNDLILITSVVKPPNTPLSYTSKRSIFTYEERFKQTQKTIESIKEKLVHAKIIIVECSDLTIDELDYFTNNCDYFLNLYSDVHFRNNVHSASKSLGEGTMTIAALQYLTDRKIKYDNFFKISGRYYLSEDFLYENFKNNDIIIKYINDDTNNVFTALFKLPYKSLVNFKTYLENNIYQMEDCIGYENLFAKFIIEEGKTKECSIKIINPIGLKGHLSVSTDFYNG